MIEVASGEYDPDMTKLAKAATKRYELVALQRIRETNNNIKNSGEWL